MQGRDEVGKVATEAFPVRHRVVSHLVALDPPVDRPGERVRLARVSVVHGLWHGDRQVRREHWQPSLLLGDVTCRPRRARQPEHQVVAEAVEAVVGAGTGWRQGEIGPPGALLSQEIPDDALVQRHLVVVQGRAHVRNSATPATATPPGFGLTDRPRRLVDGTGRMGSCVRSTTS